MNSLKGKNIGIRRKRALKNDKLYFRRGSGLFGSKTIAKLYETLMSQTPRTLGEISPPEKKE
jgi:hypothetical protein